LQEFIKATDLSFKEFKEKMTSVTQETSEKLSKELQSRVKEQSAEFHAKTTQVEENL
jgi:Sec-independent protein translocase protein TatA